MSFSDGSQLQACKIPIKMGQVYLFSKGSVAVKKINPLSIRLVMFRAASTAGLEIEDGFKEINLTLPDGCKLFIAVKDKDGSTVASESITISGTLSSLK